MNAYQPLRLVLELNKVEKELILQSIQDSRQYLQKRRIPESQKGRRIRMLLALESHIEDSWQSEVKAWENGGIE